MTAPTNSLLRLVMLGSLATHACASLQHALEAKEATGRRACAADVQECAHGDAFMDETFGMLDKDSSFFVVQLTDPQFGTENNNKGSWRNEQRMLNESLRQINRLAPGFVILTGDMQNSYPERSQEEKLVGDQQTASVLQSLSLLDSSIPLRAILPGNHDVGDVPTSATMRQYEDKWGADRASFVKNGVQFVALNSQLYWSAAVDTDMRTLATEQSAWLSKELDDAAGQGIKGIVLLSHIPPFIAQADETRGWGNWPVAARKAVLQMTQAKDVPVSLIIAGHFHANVEDVTSAAFGAPVEVVTSSSVGCAIMWNGTSPTEFSHALATAVATEPTGSEAFMKWVVRDDGGQMNWTLKGQRVAARRDLSGVRLFEFDPSAGYRHAWFTLQALPRLRAPLSREASPLAALPFVPWTTTAASR